MKKRNVTALFRWVFGLALFAIAMAVIFPQYAGWFLASVISLFGIGYLALIAHIVITGKTASKGSKKRRRAIFNFIKEGPKLVA